MRSQCETERLAPISCKVAGAGYVRVTPKTLQSAKLTASFRIRSRNFPRRHCVSFFDWVWSLEQPKISLAQAGWGIWHPHGAGTASRAASAIAAPRRAWTTGRDCTCWDLEHLHPLLLFQAIDEKRSHSQIAA